MPDFRVIDGGGAGGGKRPPDDFDIRLAAQELRAVLVELLRGVARSNDPRRRITQRLIKLFDLLADKQLPIDAVVTTMLSELHSEFTTAEISDHRSDDPDRELDHILLACFQVAAEKMCLDEAAQGRTSQRMRGLEDSLDARLMGKERRSREHGWSYLKNFLKENFSNPKLPTKKQLAADKAARRTFDDLMKERTEAAARQKPPARKKRWSPLDSRSYLDPKPED
jgi:hypothetical protein